MLFYCVWPDDASLLVDVAHDPDLEKMRAVAKAAATEEAEGSPPHAVHPVAPGVVAFHVHFDEDDAGAEVVSVEPLEHVEQLLGELEDALTPQEVLELPIAAAPSCSSVAETDEGGELRCELAADHVTRGEKHRAGAFEW